MYLDLQLALDWNSLCADSCFSVLIECGYSDVSFLTNQFLVKHVADNRAICLVLFSKTLQHFHQIASKFGINLMSMEEKGQLYVVEVLKETCSVMKGEKSDNLLYEKEGLCDVMMKITEFTQRIRDRFKHYLLLVDDLTLLINLGMSTKNVVNFIDNCHYLSRSTSGCLVVTMHSDEEDELSTHLCRFLQHRCDASIEVTQLATGHSKDISGQLTAVHNNRKCLDKIETKPIKLQFKIEDRRVLTFACGTSSGIL